MNSRVLFIMKSTVYPHRARSSTISKVFTKAMLTHWLAWSLERCDITHRIPNLWIILASLLIFMAYIHATPYIIWYFVLSAILKPCDSEIVNCLGHLYIYIICKYIYIYLHIYIYCVYIYIYIHNTEEKDKVPPDVQFCLDVAPDGDEVLLGQGRGLTVPCGQKCWAVHFPVGALNPSRAQ